MFIDFVAKAKTAPRQKPVTADAPLMDACCFDPSNGAACAELYYDNPLTNPPTPTPPLQTHFLFAKSRFLNPALSTCVICTAIPFPP